MDWNHSWAYNRNNSGFVREKSMALCSVFWNCSKHTVASAEFQNKKDSHDTSNMNTHLLWPEPLWVGAHFVKFRLLVIFLQLANNFPLAFVAVWASDLGTSCLCTEESKYKRWFFSLTPPYCLLLRGFLAGSLSSFRGDLKGRNFTCCIPTRAKEGQSSEVPSLLTYSLPFLLRR